MATTLETPLAATAAVRDEPDPRRFRALAVIAIAQLMIVLDASVVTIALPSAQRALHISLANRQWALTAYTLGVRRPAADRRADRRLHGPQAHVHHQPPGLRRRLRPRWAGAERGHALRRALQGAFAAIMAPASLSLLTVTFTEPKERARAFGVYGAVAGGGAAIGLVLGGLAHPVRLVALDAAHQCADRHRHRRGHRT